MKWIFASFLTLILLSSVLAAGQQGVRQIGSQTSPNIQTNSEYEQGTRQGIQTQTKQRTQNEGEEQNLEIQTRVRNVEELKTAVQQKRQEMIQELQNLSKNEQKIYQNQNQVRLAVHALLSMENLTGGIGRNISAIAREFNNSIQATIRVEEKIRTRNALVRFFVGGDEEAAKEMERQISQNRLRIQELKQNMEKCDCDEQVRALLQEQIQNMEQEQTRLQQLAQSEKQSKGLFGWIWKR